MARRLPDGPDGLPLVGNLKFLDSDRLDFLESVREDYGDMAYLHIANRDIFLLQHPDLIHQILVTDVGKVQKTPTFTRLLSEVIGNGLLTSEEPLHGKQRQLIQPAFHASHIKTYADIMVDYTRRMLDTWDDGESIELHDAMMKLTMQIVAKVLFNADVSEKTDELSDAITIANEDVNRRMFNPFIPPRELPTPENLEIRKVIELIEERMRAVIAERREHPDKYGDLLAMLVSATDKDGKQGMSDEQVLNEVLTLFVAGHETTATALSWTGYLLAQHPDAYNKLRQEVQSVLDNRPARFEDVERLVYTHQVVKESMRLYPPVWTVSRTPTEPISLGGYDLEPGDRLFIMPYIMHRHPDYWDAPTEFRPERFEDDDNIPDYAYFPFGGGPRVCIGASFAMMEAVLLLATMAQQFRWTLLKEQTVTPEPLLTLRPSPGINVRLQRHITG